MGELHPTIRTALAANHTVITPNRRLAARLQQAYYEEQSQEVTSTARILPLSAWIEDRWRQHYCANPTSPTLISLLAEQLLWRRLIESSATAPLSAYLRGWRLCQQYAIHAQAEAWQNSDVTLKFQHQLQYFADLLHDHHYCTSAELPDLLIAQRQGFSKINLLWVGFLSFTPQQRALYAALRTGGARITLLRSSFVRQIAHCTRYPAADADAELDTAWQYMEDVIHRDQHARATIVIPNLSHQWQAIRLRAQRSTTLSLISGGTPFSQQPLIHILLRLLTVASGKHPLSDYGGLWRQSYLCHAHDACALAQIERRLEQSRYREQTLSELLMAGTFAPALRLQQGLASWQAILATATQRTPAQWLQCFDEMLRNIGWLQGFKCDSAHFQLLEKWREALEAFLSLALVTPQLSLNEAIIQLRYLADHQIFQPQSPAQARLEILDVREARALAFDHLWICAMDHRAFAHSELHPWIPRSLQKQVMGADPSVQRRYARQLINSWRNQSRELIASYSASSEDSALPHYFIHHFPVRDVATATVSSSSATMEYLTDTQAPAVDANAPLQSLNRLLEHQSQCPFRAFAALRLQVRNPTEYWLPDAASRGRVLHLILERLWRRWRHHATLAALDDKARGDIVEHEVTTAILEQMSRYPECQTQWQQLEIQRVCALIHDWLQLELQRAPFTVEACEREDVVAQGGRTFRLRVDRLDRLADGSLMVMDYKSRSVESKWKSWLQTHLEEPQLLLYALHHGATAMAFANLHYRRDGGFSQSLSGLSEQTQENNHISIDINRLETTWETQSTQWRATIDGVYEDFCKGQAAVAPRDATACRYCIFHPLCRIGETLDKSKESTMS